MTEARPRLIEPMVQHIGRRLTLKQSANNTFIIGGGWPRGRAAAAALLDDRWDSAAGNIAIAIVVAAPRRRPGRPDVDRRDGFTHDRPVVGESSVVPGYYVLPRATGFTLMPAARADARRAHRVGSAASAKLLSRPTIVPTGPDHLRGRP